MRISETVFFIRKKIIIINWPMRISETVSFMLVFGVQLIFVKADSAIVRNLCTLLYRGTNIFTGPAIYIINIF